MSALAGERWRLGALEPLLPGASGGPVGATATRVLWIHGFLGEAADWRPLARRLPTLAHFALDLPGHGAAEPLPSDAPAHRRLAEGIAGAAVAVPGRWLLVGYSMGARVAMAVAPRLASLGRLAGAVFISGHPGLVDPAERAARLATDVARAARLRDAGLGAFVRAWYASPLLAELHGVDGGPALAAARARGSAATATARARTLVALSAGSQPNRLPELAALGPALTWVAGAEDAKYAALLRRAHEATPGSQLHVVADAGHQVHLRRPARVADLVAAAATRQT